MMMKGGGQFGGGSASASLPPVLHDMYPTLRQRFARCQQQQKYNTIQYNPMHCAAAQRSRLPTPHRVPCVTYGSPQQKSLQCTRCIERHTPHSPSRRRERRSCIVHGEIGPARASPPKPPAALNSQHEADRGASRPLPAPALLGATQIGLIDKRAPPRG